MVGKKSYRLKKASLESDCSKIGVWERYYRPAGFGLTPHETTTRVQPFVLGHSGDLVDSRVNLGLEGPGINSSYLQSFFKRTCFSKLFSVTVHTENKNAGKI